MIALLENRKDCSFRLGVQMLSAFQRILALALYLTIPEICAADGMTNCLVRGTTYSNIWDVHTTASDGRVTILHKTGGITVARSDLPNKFLESWGLGVSWIRSPETGNIEIEGSVRFTGQVSNALLLLKSAAPEAYQTVTNYVEVIREAGRSRMSPYQTRPLFEMDESTAFYSLTWCAGAIAHDSVHSKLYHDYVNTHSGWIPDSAWTGPTAEHQCLIHQLKVLKEVGAPADEVRYCAQTPDDFNNVHKYGTNYGQFYSNHLGKGVVSNDTK